MTTLKEKRTYGEVSSLAGDRTYWIKSEDVEECFKEILEEIDDINEYDDMTITAFKREVFNVIKNKSGYEK